ncbi:MAG: NUDIX hydrolase [Patescibacteria group bacterium]
MINCEFENGNKASLRHVVVDNLVLKDGKILLVKRTGKLLEGGKWGLAGGYVDRDETVKEAARREILEETGYEVERITLLRIIDAPNRPAEDRQNIAFVHFCDALEKIGVPDDESDEQTWFDLSALPLEEEFAFDHFSDIKLYLEYLQRPFALPRFE